jgi:hypothetical protein
MSVETAFGSAPELKWIKSSHSGNEHGSDCVEVAASPGTVHVRDSKDTGRPSLAFGPRSWTGFVSYAISR